MSDCLFCKIINGEIPSAKVYEDENVYAFLDIAPATKGHTLVIPKNHFENIYDISEDAARDLFAVVPKIAKVLKKQFNPVGMNLINNTGAKAGQHVFHIHLHIVPRYGKGDGYDPAYNPNTDITPAQLQELAQTIREGF